MTSVSIHIGYFLNIPAIFFGTYFHIVTKSALKAFAQGIVLCILHQFSGCFAFLNYMTSIFAASGSVMDPYFCTNIVGVSHIIGCCVATLLVEHISRRALLFFSTTGMAVGMIVFGVFIQLADTQMFEVYYWTPLVFMSIVVFFTASGLFGSFFTILVEILPAKVSFTGHNFCFKKYLF